jgi:hypothetical protein
LRLCLPLLVEVSACGDLMAQLTSNLTDLTINSLMKLTFQI